MELLMLCLLTLALFVCLKFLAKGSDNNHLRLPPGPKPLPILGNLLDLGDKPHKSLAKLAQIHGPLMSLKLGQVTTIVVSSSTMAKEFLQTHDLIFSERTVGDAIKAHQHHEFSVSCLPVGDHWKKLRKLCISYIFSTQKLDSNRDIRRKKILDLLADVHESSNVGAAVDIGRAAFKANLNALSSTLFSLDLAGSGSDSSSLEVKDIIRTLMSELGKVNLADCFSFLKRMDPQGIKRRVSVHYGRLLDMFDRIIDERLKIKESLGDIPESDILDTLLSISEDNPEAMDRNQIKHFFLDLFIAGTDTPTSTLEWAMAEMLHKPETLAKARAEIHDVIGTCRLIEESDMSRLPYLLAVIKETLRLHPPTPLLLPHRAASDVELLGFTIPEGSQVLINAWAIGRDPRIWKDAESFAPERFLKSNSDVRGNSFELIPFGVGRRACPATPLSLRMLHMMLGALNQFFEWKLADDITPENLNMDDKFGVALERAQPLQAIPTKITGFTLLSKHNY